MSVRYEIYKHRRGDWGHATGIAAKKRDVAASEETKPNADDIDSPAKATLKIGRLYSIELIKGQFGAKDVNYSLFGNPLSKQIILRVSGTEIKTNREHGWCILDGSPREWRLENPPRWVIEYSDERTYQIVIQEQSIVSTADEWHIPDTPKLGEWPFYSSMIRFGQDSYLQFEVSEIEGDQAK